jgi:hypothetical protein
MRTLHILASISALIVTCTAWETCLDEASANQVAGNFAGLISNYSDELANASLAEDFTDYSDSVIELINSGCTGPVPVSSISSTPFPASFD